MKHLIATAALTLLATTTLNASDMKQIRISTDRTDLVLQVGEESPVVPHYLEACYPAAVDGTLMEETKLKIEIVPGKEFVIKEIVAC